MASFEIENTGNDTWTLSIDNRPIVRLVMDYLGQVDKVVLLPDITPEEALSALRTAFSHATRYVVERRHSTGILHATYRGAVDRGVSARLLTEDVAREAADLDAERLTDSLRKIGITVITSKVNSLQEAIDAALADNRLKAIPITFEIGPHQDVLREQKVTFTVAPPARFRAWHHVGKPMGGFDLYIIPSYHPDLDENRHYVNLINGNTDAYIGGKAIRSVYAPPESMVGEPGFLSSSWSKVNHPFYAAGSQITIQVSPTKVLSAEGIEDLVALLAALLELENTYLSISGGFRSGYTHPQNVRNARGIRTGSWKGEARGSEGFCVWAYQVLEKEGELERAYIPAWFHQEGWLRAYEEYGYTD